MSTSHHHADASAGRDSAAGPRLRRRWAWWTAGIVVGLVLNILLVFALHPWPGALLIRSVFEQQAAEAKAAMEAHAPEDVVTIADQQYRPGDDDAFLDVYVSATADQGEVFPTLVWTHGGAWLSGHRDDAAPYFELIAAQGYTVVSLGYSLAPGATYPTPIHQINDAFAYLADNAGRLHVDVDHIVIAGDSAGAQITSQIATMVTSLSYADELGLTPNLQPEQLRGVILYCGYYDMETFVEDGELGPIALLRWGIATTVWAYTGSRATDSPLLEQMSVLDRVTAEFPPVFISGGNADPLTDPQSRPLAARLESLGVDVTTLFFPEDHKPALGHEYQFDLDNADGQRALTETLTFLGEHTTPR